MWEFWGLPGTPGTALPYTFCRRARAARLPRCQSLVKGPLGFRAQRAANMRAFHRYYLHSPHGWQPSLKEGSGGNSKFLFAQTVLLHKGIKPGGKGPHGLFPPRAVAPCRVRLGVACAFLRAGVAIRLAPPCARSGRLSAPGRVRPPGRHGAHGCQAGFVTHLVSMLPRSPGRRVAVQAG